MSHMLNRRLATGFTSWLGAVQAKRGDDPMAKAMRYLQPRACARLVCWYALYEKKRSSSRCAYGAHANRELSRGFGAWHIYASERKDFMQN